MEKSFGLPRYVEIRSYGRMRNWDWLCRLCFHYLVDNNNNREFSSLRVGEEAKNIPTMSPPLCCSPSSPNWSQPRPCFLPPAPVFRIFWVSELVKAVYHAWRKMPASEVMRAVYVCVPDRQTNRPNNAPTLRRPECPKKKHPKCTPMHSDFTNHSQKSFQTSRCVEWHCSTCF